MFRFLTPLTPLAPLALIVTTGCGLIAPDVTDVQLSFPPKEFTIDSESWGLTESVSTVPTVSCATSATVCADAETQFCDHPDCEVTCDGTNCEGQVVVALAQSYDLSAVESYREAGRYGPITVTVDDVWFEVEENTFGVDSPELMIYVAPAAVIDAADAAAKPIGRVRSMRAKGTGRGEVELSPNGRVHLEALMEDYETPFNVLVGATVVLRAGQPMPHGRMRGFVQATAHTEIRSAK